MNYRSGIASGVPHIVHVLGTAHVGGTERQLLLLLDHLDRERFCSTVLLIRGGPLLGEFQARADTQVVGKRSGFDPWFFARLVKALGTLRPAITHSMGPTPNLWVPLASKLAGAESTVMSVTDAASRGDPIRRAVERFMMHNADRVVGNSEATVRSAVTRGASPTAVDVIYSGVPQPHSAVVPRQENVLALVGRLDPVKGQDVAVEALPRIIARFPQVRLVIGGNAVLESERSFSDRLRIRIAALGIANNVELVGPLPSSQDLLASATVAVLPSRSDALPNVMLEAMALETPVVATHVGGIPELIEDGVSGWLVPPGRPDALADAILEVMTDPAEAKTRARAGRERSMSLNPSATARRWMELYDRLLHPLVEGRK